MKRQKVPAYGLHKSTGQARVYVGGRSIYLGEFGSEASRIRYGEIVAKVVSGQPIDPFVPKSKVGSLPTELAGLTVNELCLAFMRHAATYYTKNGKPSDEVWCFKSALKPLIEMYGFVPVDQIGPLQLKAVRQAFIVKGWCRGFCNKSTNRVRHVWKWGVENGMVNSATLQALQAVAPLKAGKCAAPDHKPREAVDSERIEAVRPHLSQHHRDLFDLLLATGSRPSELLGLSMADIDITGDIWLADLTAHKNAHRGLSRKLFFGPRSQLILRRLPATGLLFTIKIRTFSAAVQRACKAAGIDPFVPYELRHTKLTEIRDEMGIESAQATGGHAQPSMTAHYSSKLDKLAIESARRLG
jgi:integrase